MQWLLAAAQEEGGVVINEDAQDEDGMTPLHFACKRGNLPIVRMLKNSNVEIKENENGCTPLHVACGRGQIE